MLCKNSILLIGTIKTETTGENKMNINIETIH